MKWKAALKNVLKLLITVGIFVAIFMEVGGGPVSVDRQKLLDGSALLQSNPEMPGIVSRLKAKVKGTELPPARVPITLEQVCKAAAERGVFVETTQGQVVPLKALRHCEGDTFAQVLGDAGEMAPLSAAAGAEVRVLKQGFQLVPMDMADLWREIKSIDMAVFLPWFLFAMAIKSVGIVANIWRWQVLLAGQNVRLSFGWLSCSYMVGRYFGIVTPSTMGLDGWRLYDTIQHTKKPVECTTALGVERIIGLVGLMAVILGFMPFANLGDRSLGELVAAMAVPLAASTFFAMLLLLQPTWFSWMVALVPSQKAKTFLQNVITAATAYSSHRGSLLLALGCAILGQVTTMFMYFGNAMALQVEGVTMAQVLYASAVMTLGTFLAPSASGEGVRELVFVALLGGRTSAAKAFLIGHLGFWIEKLPLSIPGGLLLLIPPAVYRKVSTAEMDALKASKASPAAGGA